MEQLQQILQSVCTLGEALTAPPGRLVLISTREKEGVEEEVEEMEEEQSAEIVA